MWPFKSQEQRKTEAVTFAAAAAAVAFGPFFKSGELLQVFHSDPYVAGYFFNRVMGLAYVGCANAKVDQRWAELCTDGALILLLGGKAKVRGFVDTIKSMKATPEGAADFDRGEDDALAIFRFPTGKNDIQTHPRFAEIENKRRAVDSVFGAGGDANISRVTLLEGMELGNYLETRYGPPTIEQIQEGWQP